MLHVSPWIKWLTLIVVVVGLLWALPNALSDRMLARLPSWLPNHRVNLGLDLQGGSYLLLELDLPQVQKDKADALMADIGAALRKARIGITGLEAHNDTVSVTVTDMSRYGEAKTVVQGLNPVLTSSLTGAARAYDLSEPGGGKMVLRQSQAFAEQTRQQILQQSVEVVRRRIDELGTREPSIVPEQPDRIVVEVPGLSDPAQLKEILGKTAKMTFKLVDMAADNMHPATAPIGDDILPVMTAKGQAPRNVVVRRRTIVDGDRLTDAAATFDSTTGQPAVTTRFDSVGTRQFGDMTKELAPTHGRFAIVLDGQVLSDPYVSTPIYGVGQISGSFTTETANTLAMMLRAGALPAKLNVIEERTVGAELGADSIKAGSWAALIGLGLVALFMVLRYGLFGIFADLALTLNLILLLAALTPLATLTLPGIAGIVLTLGMAVDANVLIFERIREEQRNGRGMLGAIDTGFKRAMATIFDANATHLIAAMVLFQLNASGPIKGFAVALFLGIITSFFTSVVVTRLIVITWLNVARPRTLKI